MPASAPQRGDVVRIRDERWTVAESSPHRDATVLTVVGCDRANRGCRARYLLPFEPIERLPSVDTSRIVSHRTWQRMARRVLAQAVPSADSLIAAAAADIAILPYQLEPALALMSGLATRILIGDDVGLGKTVQAGVIVAETLARRQDAHVLVLCPAGLRTQWHEELTNRFRLAPVVLDSASLLRLPLNEHANPWSAHPLILTSTDYIKRPEVLRALESLVWDLLVIDEAHGIAGNSDRHATAALLAQRARSVVMLTATPHSGDDVAFARLAAIGDLESSFPLVVFRRTRANTSGGMRRRTRWLPVRLTDAELAMHRALIAYVQRVWRHPASSAARLAMIILTRRACSGAFSLARTVERRLALLTTRDVETEIQLPLGLGEPDDEEPGYQVGAPGLADVHDERHALRAILGLAQRACSASGKIRALIRLLRRSSEPAIVFTEYRDTLAELARFLTGFSTCQLHGGLTAAERADVIRAFTTGTSNVLLATDAASEGLNLQQRCRLVVHLEVPWTPTRIEQRVGRVDRIGQCRTVHQMHLIARGTVEESHVTAVVQRASTVASTLDSLSSRQIDEQHVAGWAIGGDVLPDAPGVNVPPGIATVDLRVRSASETERLITTRRLQPTAAAEFPTHTQPFVAIGKRLSAGRSWWALWLECADANGQLAWESLVAVEATHRWARPHRLSELRALLDGSWKQARRHIEGDHVRLGNVHAQALRAPAAIALERERAIATALERQRARMAASLLQGGLFDRRIEREAVAQRELLDHALSRCHTRIEELQRRQTASVIANRPAFALISW